MDPAKLAESAMDSKLDPSFTYAFDKYSCLKGAHAAHVAFAYVVAITGALCFITRLWKRVYFLHAPLGRVYVTAMLWTTATSLLIHNTGLPTATLVSFLWVLGGLTIAWALINVHQAIMQRRATAAAAARIREAGGAIPGGDLGALIASEKGRIAASKGFWARILSLKAAHGALMFVTWINIVGRVFSTPGLAEFSCHTYPYYKRLDTPDFDGAEQPLTPVPVHDPDYQRLPWAKMGPVVWGLVLLFGPLVGAFIFGAVWSAVAAKHARVVAARADNGHHAAANGNGAEGKGALA